MSTHVEIRSLAAGEEVVLFSWINSPEMVRLNSTFRPVHWKDHMEWFDSVRRQQDREIFAIQSNGELVGYVQLSNINHLHRKAELSIRIGVQEMRGRGVGTAAIGQVLDHARRDLGLQRIYLHVFCSNAPAIRAYLKAGFQIEGTLRRDAYIDGRLVDTHVMGRLLDDRDGGPIDVD